MISTNTDTITDKYIGNASHYDLGRTTHHHRRAAITTLRRSLALIAALMLATAGVAQAADSVERLSGVVNLNTANAEQLQMLPGVGEKRAEAIIAIRSSKGGFKKVEEIVEVKGVGDALLERLRPHWTVSGKTTAKLL